MKSSENHKSMLNFQNVMEKVLSAYSETVIYTDFIYIYTHTQLLCTIFILLFIQFIINMGKI